MSTPGYSLFRCPDCELPMRLISVKPVPSAQNTDEITYRCEVRLTEIKHQAKTKSLDWKS